MHVYIAGDAKRFGNYYLAIKVAGGQVWQGGDAAESDALLLPGGGDVEPWHYGQKNSASIDLEPERDLEDLALMEKFVAQKKPVLGICRGMQIINVFFGGTLIQDIPGHHMINGRDHEHTVRTDSLRRFPGFGEGAIVNSAHHQAVDRLGEGLRAVQWAPDGVIEGVIHQTLPIWGVQWHPERMKGLVGTALITTFMENCR